MPEAATPEALSPGLRWHGTDKGVHKVSAPAAAVRKQLSGVGRRTLGLARPSTNQFVLNTIV